MIDLFGMIIYIDIDDLFVFLIFLVFVCDDDFQMGGYVEVLGVLVKQGGFGCVFEFGEVCFDFVGMGRWDCGRYVVIESYVGVVGLW